jgi:hypothetical protein
LKVPKIGQSGEGTLKPTNQIEGAIKLTNQVAGTIELTNQIQEHPKLIGQDFFTTFSQF